MVEYTPDATEHGLKYKFGHDWQRPPAAKTDGQAPEAADPTATLLHLCMEASGRQDHKTALKHARVAREQAQEALVSAVESDGFMPVVLVAQLVVAYHNIGYNLGCLGRSQAAQEWLAKGVEIAVRHLGEDHAITRRVQGAEATEQAHQEQKKQRADEAEERERQQAEVREKIERVYPRKNINDDEGDEAEVEEEPVPSSPAIPPGWMKDPRTGVVKPIPHLDNCPRRFETEPEVRAQVAKFVGLPPRHHRVISAAECPCNTAQIGRYKLGRSPVRKRVAKELASAHRELRDNMERIMNPKPSGMLTLSGLNFLSTSSGSVKRDRSTLPPKVQQLLEKHTISPKRVEYTSPKETSSPPRSQEAPIELTGAEVSPSKSPPRPRIRPTTAPPKMRPTLHVTVKEIQRRCPTASRSRPVTSPQVWKQPLPVRPQSAAPLFAKRHPERKPVKMFRFSNGRELSTPDLKAAREQRATPEKALEVNVVAPVKSKPNDREDLTKLMLLMHKYESTQEVMMHSNLVDAPHCPPKPVATRPSCNYGQAVTTLHNPGRVLKKEPEDRWNDRITETGFLSLARKCCVSVGELKSLKEEWDAMTRNRRKGLSKKQFVKIFSASPLSAAFQEDEFEEAADELFWAMDQDGDEKISYFELALGFSELLMPEHKDALAVRKRQLMRDYEAGVSLCYRILDDNMTSKVNLFNLYKFMGETLPGYRYRKRLGDALFESITGNPSVKEITPAMFMDKMMESNVIWQIFATLIPWKYADHSSEGYVRAREEFLKDLNANRVNNRYAFEVKASLDMGSLVDFL